MALEKQRVVIRQSLIVLATLLSGLVGVGWVERLGGPSFEEVDQLLFLFGSLSALAAGYVLFRKQLAPLRMGSTRLLVVVFALSIGALAMVSYGGVRMPDPVVIALLVTSFFGTYFSRRSS